MTSEHYLIYFWWEVLYYIVSWEFTRWGQILNSRNGTQFDVLPGIYLFYLNTLGLYYSHYLKAYCLSCYARENWFHKTIVYKVVSDRDIIVLSSYGRIFYYMYLSRDVYCFSKRCVNYDPVWISPTTSICLEGNSLLEFSWSYNLQVV